MKFLSLSFIICVAVLLTQPCQDTLAAVRDNIDGQNKAAAYVQQPSESDPCSEDCSPFCICSCRQVPTAQHDLDIVSIPDVGVLNLSTPDIEYKNPSTDSFHNSIWQPPKP